MKRARMPLREDAQTTVRVRLLEQYQAQSRPRKRERRWPMVVAAVVYGGALWVLALWSGAL